MQTNWGELELAATRDVVMASYEDFVKELWPSIIPEKLHWNWHMSLICEELQFVGENILAGKKKLHDLIINVPPGTSKTTLVTIMFPAWLHARNPQLRVIAASYSHTLTSLLASKARDLMKSDRYRELFPEVEIRKDNDSKTFFKLTKGGERFATSTGSTVVGQHGHLLVLDDPVNQQQVMSAGMMEQTNEWIAEYFLTRKVNKEDTPLIMIMQRLHESDPTAYLLKRLKKVRHICLPAEDYKTLKPEHLRERYVDGLLDPHRMPRKILESMETEMGGYGYGSQMLQEPTPRGGTLFMPEKIQLVTAPPSRITKIIRGWDKAGTAGNTSDYTVGVKMGIMEDKRFIILDVVRGRWEIHEREARIQRVACLDTDEVKIAIERNSGEGGWESAQNTIRNLAGFVVELATPTGSKVDRAEALATQINAGNVLMIKDEWNQLIYDEFSTFPLGKYDDVVDAATIAFNKLFTKKRAGTW